MKTSIHPQYFNNATVICVCGNSFTTGSTRETIHAEVCYKCHPFFTGELKYVDTLGRVEKFQKKQQFAQTKIVDLQKKKAKKQGKIEKPQGPKTLREMLLWQTK